jgi:hypothetical protein
MTNLLKYSYNLLSAEPLFNEISGELEAVSYVLAEPVLAEPPPPTDSFNHCGQSPSGRRISYY